MIERRSRIGKKHHGRVEENFSFLLLENSRKVRLVTMKRGDPFAYPDALLEKATNATQSKKNIPNRVRSLAAGSDEPVPGSQPGGSKARLWKSAAIVGRPETVCANVARQ